MDKAYASSQNYFGKEPSGLACMCSGHVQGEQGPDRPGLGCGQGRDTRYLARTVFRVTALDCSAAGIARYGRRLRGKDWTRS